ncbi:hypothetical protein [Kitasatospora sp. NBC_01266]|uniref:hypothetical protein n=1 Tax=Kitasatospora sp. NBC_01266 TaxID=2903572 RepID=UPI002E314169|nr:hypothetical protein [Kitasatospora sp. NBC_01266]
MRNPDAGRGAGAGAEDDWPSDGSTYRAPAACPLCAGELRAVEVDPHTDRPGRLLVKVFVPGKVFARKSTVEALACRGCGHLLFFMANPEIMDTPPPWSRRWR